MVTTGVGRGSVEVLSRREQAVLELMAQGRSNRAISRELWLSEKTVETHVRSIFQKLELPPDDGMNRRVRAVLAWLREGVSAQAAQVGQGR